jgi:hypothetical protein
VLLGHIPKLVAPQKTNKLSKKESHKRLNPTLNLIYKKDIVSLLAIFSPVMSQHFTINVTKV